MNQEIKAQWVAALRSGEYKQGTGVLQCDDEYCCLGILCVLARKAGVQVRLDSNQIVGVLLRAQPAVLAWSGIEDDNSLCVKGIRLTTLNDGRGCFPPHSFIEIADLIEKSDL